MFAQFHESAGEPTMTSPQERRRTRRYTVALPIQVVKLRRSSVAFKGETCNVSSSGALFVISGARPPEGAEIEFRLSMRGSALLHCKGRVTRIEEAPEGPGFGIAATIDRYRFVRPSALSPRQ
ncbi:MAG: PilZ domain-containing protein [Bryobacterales bacterium]